MSKQRLYLFDTTLRDGAADHRGRLLSLEDKRLIIRVLDELGLDYIEGGYPGANLTDTQLFSSDLKLACADLYGLRYDQAGGPFGVQRSGLSSHPTGQSRRDLPRRQGLGLSRAGGARHQQRGEPGGHRAIG